MRYIAPIIPDNSPLSPGQRAWPHRLLAGLLRTHAAGAAAAPPLAPRAPLPARFEGALRLNRDGSEKDIRHVVFAHHDLPLQCKAGDALGVHAANDPELVCAIIERLGASVAAEVDCPDGTRRPLREALLEACDIARPSDRAIEVLASRARDPGEADRLQALAEGYPGAEPADADLLDLLFAFPSAQPPVQELVLALARLEPRLYSIASSPKMHAGEVHLTVAAVRYSRRGRMRKGVASTFLADRVDRGSAVSVFVKPAQGFELPKHPSTSSPSRGRSASAMRRRSLRISPGPAATSATCTSSPPLSRADRREAVKRRVG